jgi:hypothetical protein
VIKIIIQAKRSNRIEYYYIRNTTTLTKVNSEICLDHSRNIPKNKLSGGAVNQKSILNYSSNTSLKESANVSMKKGF